MLSESKLLKRKSQENGDDANPEKPNDQKISKIIPIKINLSAQSDEEEIPMEAKIRMRNLGRFTPTSSGPNSFGKGRFGFIDRKALLDKQTEALNSAVSEDG